MTGKVCMVTGATSGLGAVTAHVLAHYGAEVVVVGRSPTKCAATVDQIKQRTGSSTVDWLRSDFTSQQDIRQLATDFEHRYGRLDVLINNAGAIFGRRQLSVDGIEMTFAVNHVSHFLLTNLLLDTMRRSAPARIVNVSSGSHAQAEIDFDDLNCQRRYRPMRAYAKSKLANLLFTYELARRLEGTAVTANAVDPGLVRTNIAAGAGPLGLFIQTLIHLRYYRFSRSAEEGATTITYLATSPAADRISGKYFVDQRAGSSSERSHDATTAERLWDVSVELAGLRTLAK